MFQQGYPSPSVLQKLYWNNSLQIPSISVPIIGLHYRLRRFFFIERMIVNTSMRFTSFIEYIQYREGLLAPDKPRWAGMPRMNTTPMTNQQRRKLLPKKPPKLKTAISGVPVFKPYQPAKPPRFVPYKPAQPAKIAMQKKEINRTSTTG